MPYFIGVEVPDVARSISKEQFESILKENNGQIPENVGLVYVMCAGWSCSAGTSYYNDLYKRGVDISRVVDYAGGFHEWRLYNRLNSSVFKIYHLSEDEKIRELSTTELNELLKFTAHSYKTNTLINNESEVVKNLCNSGSLLPNILVSSASETVTSATESETIEEIEAIEAVPASEVSETDRVSEASSANVVRDK